MLVLEPNSLTLKECLLSRFNSEKHEIVDITLHEFDNVEFHVYTPDENRKSLLVLSVKLYNYHELAQLGDVMGVMRDKYGTYLQTDDQVEQNYDFGLWFDLDNMEGVDKEQLAHHVSFVKKHALSVPFLVCFEGYAQEQSQPQSQEYSQAQARSEQSKNILRVNYRENEYMYLQQLNDRITVTLSTVLENQEMDTAICKVFLQEFLDYKPQTSSLPTTSSTTAGGGGTGSGSGGGGVGGITSGMEGVSISSGGTSSVPPQVSVSFKEPPLEIRDFVLPQSTTATATTVAYITFVFFPRHFSSDEARSKLVDNVMMFRTYLHFHIKCAKAYIHSRMRSRVESFLKVLNRAKPLSQQSATSGVGSPGATTGVGSGPNSPVFGGVGGAEKKKTFSGRYMRH